jgi:hypothetical protein
LEKREIVLRRELRVDRFKEKRVTTIPANRKLKLNIRKSGDFGCRVC